MDLELDLDPVDSPHMIKGETDGTGVRDGMDPKLR